MEIMHAQALRSTEGEISAILSSALDNRISTQSSKMLKSDEANDHVDLEATHEIQGPRSPVPTEQPS